MGAGADSPQERQLTDDQIAAILAAHELYLSSDGEQGDVADLRRADLSGRDLRGANLQRANLAGADLSEANLCDARLGKACLRDTSLYAANLTDANLEGAVDLLGRQMAGANLTRAKLPDRISAFEGLKQADRMADNVQKLYILLLGACAYTILTLATTPDSKLITNSATAPLPIKDRT